MLLHQEWNSTFVAEAKKIYIFDILKTGLTYQDEQHVRLFFAYMLILPQKIDIVSFLCAFKVYFLYHEHYINLSLRF